MTYILVLFALMLDGSQQALGGEFPTQAACEAKMQELQPAVAKHPAVVKYVITCQPGQLRDAV